MDAAAWYLQLDDFNPDQVLENRLYTARPAGPAQDQFLDSLAAGTPAPGGGSASAYAGAMAAGLVAMVARLTTGKKKYAEVEGQMTEIVNQADRLRLDLNAAVDRDASAFEAILAAFKLPRETEDQQSTRELAIEQATLNAIAVPLQVAEMAVKVMSLAERCAALGNINAISDAAAAGALAGAALTGAGYNVRINVNSLTDKLAGDASLASLTTLEKKAAHLEKEIRSTLKERGGIAAS
jgi:glutamate formiminotransferase/formiminotetrahydrofolate cyclodeaminase